MPLLSVGIVTGIGSANIAYFAVDGNALNLGVGVWCCVMAVCTFLYLILEKNAC